MGRAAFLFALLLPRSQHRYIPEQDGAGTDARRSAAQRAIGACAIAASESCSAREQSSVACSAQWLRMMMSQRMPWCRRWLRVEPG